MNEDKSTRYHRHRRRTRLLETTLLGTALLALVVTGGAAMLRDWAGGLAASSPLATVVWFVLPLAGLTAALQMSFVRRTVALERRYGFADAGGRWWWAALVNGSLGFAVAVVGVSGVWLLLRAMPTAWWVAGAAAVFLARVIVAALAPVIASRRAMPLVRPALSTRLSQLADRAGTPVIGAFEWHAGADTRRGNARLIGLGRTRRVLVSETLLASHSDEEVEVVVAHELAHHVHHDMWAMLILDGVLVAACLYFANLVLGASVGHFGVAAKSDLAGVPIVVLAAGAASLLLVPVANALSRVHERRADRFALEMTGNAPAFTSVVRRLAAQHLAEERPSRWVEMLFHSHPPAAARIEFARAWDSSRSRRLRSDAGAEVAARHPAR